MRAVVLLEIVLAASTRLAAWVWALESLDASVYPLMTLEMATCGETALADAADVRLWLAVGGTGRAILALGRSNGWALRR